MKPLRTRIRVGIGGWSYEPWRGLFYPEDLAQKRELGYASSQLDTIEINSTFYGPQKPQTFAKWRDATPDGFVFAVKAPRFATNRRNLREAEDSIKRFINGGVTELGTKLGPINWQLAPGKQFDAEELDLFFKMLPAQAAGITLRHALEVRHASFVDPAFVALARRHAVAVVIAGDSDYPQIGDATAPFVYARIMGTTDAHTKGYSTRALGQWAKRALEWQAGGSAKGVALATEPAKPAAGRDVFLYVISGHKALNPAAALGLKERLS